MKRILFFCVFVLLAGFMVLFLWYAGTYLVREDLLVKTDAALVFSGDPNFERTKEAVRLYKEGWAKKIVLTGHGYSGDDALSMKSVAVESGVSPGDILLENTSTSTYTNLLFTKDIITSRGFTTVTFVSSPYHMRRIWTLKGRIYGENGIAFYCHPVRGGIWSPSGWWKKPQGRRPVFQEYVKLLAFWLFDVLDQHDRRIVWIKSAV